MTDAEKVGYCTDIWAAVEYGHGRAAQCATLDMALNEHAAELQGRIRELEDALLDALGGDAGGGIFHLFRGQCPDETDGTEWQRDPDCPDCRRLERLIGHRRPS